MNTSILLKFYCIDSVPEIQIGALLEDYINEANKESFSEEIMEGCSLQQHLTFFMLNHPAYLDSEKLLDCTLRKRSAKIIPIFYDHFMRVNWSSFSEVPFEVFHTKLKDNFVNNQQNVPFKYNRLLHYVFKQDWYNQFQTIGGTHWIMKQQTKRFNFNTNLEHSINSLIEHYSDHKANFFKLLPDLEQEYRNYSQSKKLVHV